MASEATTPSDPAPATEALRARVSEQFPALRADLERLVRVPSVSNPAFDQRHIEDSAQLVAELMRAAGLERVRVLRVAAAPTAEAAGGEAAGADGAGQAPAGGAPAVVGHRPGPPGAPTVLLYAHHDVQPPGDRAQWDSEPFEPVERAGRLYGRGAADDKAGVVVHLGALRALGDDLPVGVTVFVEGEEEVGSPTFPAFLEAHREDLAADVIVVADSFNWAVGTPALTTILRGLVDVVVEVRVLEHGVHSGAFGGVVPDALTALARLLATLHDADGDVAVPGLVRASDPAVDYDEDTLRAEAGVLPGVRLTGTGPLSARLWTRPAVSVIGLDAPRVDEASNTLVPAARAKVSLRLAPGQDPAAAMAALRDHLLGHAPFGARVTVTEGAMGPPFAAPPDSPAMRAARWAFEQAWGNRPVDMGVGGSIPFISELLGAFPEAEILVTGVEDPGSRAHGPNESVHLGDLERAVLAEALLLRRLGAGGA